MTLRVAVAFPGQGAEQVYSPVAPCEWWQDECFAWASAATGVDVPRAFQRMDLRTTAVLQPALVALSLVAWRRLRARGVDVHFVCGHSVGEIAAWAAAGGLLPQEAIELAAARGVAMDDAARAFPGGMVAVDAKNVELVRERCNVELAATNGPSQVVFSGDESAIDAVVRLGGRRLGARGPWHSRAMAIAIPATDRALSRLVPRPATLPLLTCLDGRALAPGESPDLAAQLTAPVAWDAVMRTLHAERITDVVCLAPGRVNRGLLRDGLGSAVRLHLADDEASLDRAAQRLQEKESHDRPHPRP